MLGLSRSTYYYEPTVDEESQRLKRLLDKQYLLTPFYGSRRMTAELVRQGEQVNRKRVQGLMREMGLEAIYPKVKTSIGDVTHKKFPYLLRGLVIDRKNQVWSTDITYIPMPKGNLYLVAVMDWYSRYVLSWAVSTSMEVSFCMEALERSLAEEQPEILNTDQGSQFTSEEYTSRVLRAGVKMSMDGRGRALDNVFVERLWRSVKYEEVYLREYLTVRDAREGIGRYLRFYNEERPHQSLNYRTPREVHWEKGR